MNKSTEALINELRSAFQISGFLEQNKDEFINKSLQAHLEKLLIDKGLSKPEIIEKSNIERGYCYQIFAGHKNPSRDKIIALAFAFSLDLEETQRLLKIAESGELYPRSRRDSIIIFCINKHMKLIDANILLDDFFEFPVD